MNITVLTCRKVFHLYHQNTFHTPQLKKQNSIQKYYKTFGSEDEFFKNIRTITMVSQIKLFIFVYLLEHMIVELTPHLQEMNFEYLR